MSKSTPDGGGLGKFQALGLVTVYSLAYVLPLYSSSATRPSLHRSRDAPGSIRARIRIVSLATGVCSLGTLMLLFFILDETVTQESSPSPWHWMGFYPVGLREAVRACTLTAGLFAGPLYESLVIDGLCLSWLSLEPIFNLWKDLPLWRNVVAGPVTEECLFRSATIPLMLLARYRPASIVLLTPMAFGLAHLHHFYEFRITNPRTPLHLAIARSVFQLAYTSLFGAYATFTFLRTGSLLAVILVHAFCNCMGLPRLWGSVEPFWIPSHKLSQSAVLPWTCLYYILLVGGLAFWWQNLYSLTSSHMALVGVW